MCLPGKRLKKAFSDDVESKPTKPAAAPQATKSSPTSTATKASTMSPKVAIIIYSMYGHIAKLAESVKKGIEASGGSATIYQIAETLPEAVLKQLYAPPKPAYPILDPANLAQFDAFVLGVPTRFGTFPAQWKAFWDATGQLWASGALVGKYASVFVSTAGAGGGQESTVLNSLSTLVHHGINFVPFGYGKAFA
ncbi:benzoquinone reductase, partial [Polyporus arcularius HHB13444]